jgi:hypothetical protein
MHREEHLAAATQAIRAPRVPKRQPGADTERVITPADVHVYAESILTKVARGFAIARDAVLIAGAVLVVLGLHSLLAGLHNAVQPDQAPPVPAVSQSYPCPVPTTDKYGTFCPLAPGD